MSRLLSIGLVLCLGAGSLGCATSPLARFQSPPVENPFFVAGNNQEAVWERTIDVLHDYQFQIGRENKLDGIIQTEYKVGSGILEPWERDSIGLGNRLESTLQSIRRRVIVSVTPTEGGFLIGVEALKELENVNGLAANSVGGATFQENSPLNRDLDLAVGQTAPSGWIPLGRDFALESALLASLQGNFSR